MNIYISGVGTHNKGAELMALAIRDHYARSADVGEETRDSRPRSSAPRLVVDLVYGAFEDRTREGFFSRLDAMIHPTLSVARAGGGASRVAAIPERVLQMFRTGLSSWLTPLALHELLGVVRDKEIDVVLDASGFLYSDQWSPRSLSRAARLAKRWRQQGKKIVLMPQAFGPFENPTSARAARMLIDSAHLVYARDRESYDHVLQTAGNQGKVRLVPDFTNLLEPIDAGQWRYEDEVAVIIPNSRMVDKIAEGTTDQYVAYLGRCIDAALQLSLRPIILYFDPSDATLGRELTQKGAEEVYETDPRRLKGIIRDARVVLSSRFHGLVCALTQGVPAIGTGWSHKYDQLFAEYGCDECLIDLDASTQQIGDLMHRLTQGEGRDALIKNLLRTGRRQQEEVEAMWKEIDELIWD